MNAARHRLRVALAVVTSAVALPLVQTAPASAAPGYGYCDSSQAAVIGNGTVQLGVCADGNLGLPAAQQPQPPRPASAGGANDLGVRYVGGGANAEGVAIGCICEGWGVADGKTGSAGFVGSTGRTDLTPVAFSASSTSAVVKSNVLDDLDDDPKTPGNAILQVIQDFHPSAAAGLYEVTTTLRNVSGATIEPRYRRVTDWDVEPTPAREYISLKSGTANFLTRINDNGLAGSNPLSTGFGLNVEGNVTDQGPSDHGTLFDLAFPSLAPGSERTFRMYIGAAGSEADVNAALTAVGVEAYGLAQSADGSVTGSPQTFAIGFTGIGGAPVFGGATPPGGGDPGTQPIGSVDPTPIVDPTPPPGGGGGGGGGGGPAPTNPPAVVPGVTPSPLPSPGPSIDPKSDSAIALSLLKQLVPKGKRARIGKLVSTRSFPLTVSVTRPGKLTVTWYRIAGKKHIKIASAKATYKKAGKKTLTLKLDKTSLRLLRKAKKFRIYAESRFRPTGGHLLKASRTFTVKR